MIPTGVVGPVTTPTFTGVTDVPCMTQSIHQQQKFGQRSHDYSPKQRESIKQALAEAKRKADEDADDQGQPLNYRLRVVGQSSRIKVIQVNTQ